MGHRNLLFAIENIQKLDFSIRAILIMFHKVTDNTFLISFLFTKFQSIQVREPLKVAHCQNGKDEWKKEL